MGRRGFDAARITRLSEDWDRTPVAPNQDVRKAWTALLARARDLYNNTSHIKGFIQFRLPAQVLGSKGVQILPQVRRTRGSSLNNSTNNRIRDAWLDFCRKGNCTMDGQSSMIDVQEQILQSVVRDGECLVQLVRGREAGNKYNFGLHLIEGEHLDPSYDARQRNGNRVIMGKEINRWRRPEAYWIAVDNPHDLSFTFRSHTRERVEARSIIHPYVPFFPSQVRGISWLHAGAGDGRMLAKYREAELVAARVAASKAVLLQAEDGAIAAKIEGHTEKQVEGQPVWDLQDQVEPGQVSAIPPGWKASQMDPTHPNGNFEAFETAILRGLAASLGASYHGFSNDLSNVNYSSARAGAVDEREVWRRLQRWFIEHVMQPVFEAWLEMAFLGDTLRGVPPQTTPAILAGVGWQARGFTWVDPSKEQKAAEGEIASALTSRTQILASRGEDFREIAEQLAEEERLLKELGIGQTPAPGESETDDGDEDKKTDDDDDDDDPDA